MGLRTWFLTHSQKVCEPHILWPDLLDLVSQSAFTGDILSSYGGPGRVLRRLTWKVSHSLNLWAISPSRHTPFIQASKKSTKINFWVRRPPGGVGVFHAKGWWSKSSCPASKVLPWDVPGILPGCPGPLGVFKRFVQKKVRAHFSFPIYTLLNWTGSVFPLLIVLGQETEGPPECRLPGRTWEHFSCTYTVPFKCYDYLLEIILSELISVIVEAINYANKKISWNYFMRARLDHPVSSSSARTSGLKEGVLAPASGIISSNCGSDCFPRFALLVSRVGTGNYFRISLGD